MNQIDKQPASGTRRRLAAGYTLVELMVALFLTTVVVLPAVWSLYLNGQFSFTAMANYQQLDVKSYMALDLMSREIRNSSQLTSYVTNQSLTFFNNYARNGAGQTTVIVYNSTAGTLNLKRTGQADVTVLTNCDSWSYQLYKRAPDMNSFTTNIMFYPATKASECKVVQMSWKCSRPIKGSKMTSESVQTAQIVLRNKP
jgi:Tfp pilus assembly protein PilV